MFDVSCRWLLTGLLAVAFGGRLLAEPPAATGSSAAAADDQGWRPLPATDGGPWEPCRFGGDGEVVIQEGLIKLGFGDPLTGVRCKATLPRENYELRLQSRRTSNFDFFCGLTFPVGKGHCSLILGGWSGSVLGLSNIDGEDASSNPTTQFRTFDNDRWYKVRVRVDDQRIQAWVDDKKWVDQERAGHTFDIRGEMEPCLPLGIAAYQCDAEAREIFWRPLPKAAAAAPAESADAPAKPADASDAS